MRPGTSYFLAVDIGASSGRHILGSVQDGKLRLQEIYRFENGMVEKNGSLCWELDRLFHEILNGMKECARLGKIPKSMGIDTWGVDFVLLDENGQMIGDPVAYRDKRTQGIEPEVYGLIPEEELYARTGIQYQTFNTVFQLYALKKEHPKQLQKARRFLMLPEYFNYLLTGEMVNEYTNASTTALLNAKTKTWDETILRAIGVNPALFGVPQPPKTVVGCLTPAIAEQVGFSCEVVLPATHDTGSAVLAVPAESGDAIYISSGTWSLMGVERPEPDCSEKSRARNFTNEGGYNYQFRFIKNIMGLWIIQSIRRELPQKMSFDELCEAAVQSEAFASRIDVNDQSFLKPKNMAEAVKAYCRRTGQAEPQNIGELMACVYHSLAQSYGETVKEIEAVTGKQYDRIHIVGGGSKDTYLNRLTARYTGKEVYAGPTEATAIGNLLAQMLRDEIFETAGEARRAVAASFEIKRTED